MKNKIVSVIIPVYNVEQYLNRCILSIINQTYRDLEIILVDDGSKDNSPLICDKWAKKDKRIIVIHKKNGGLSSARNAGLDVASGDYISFVDSDDWIESKMIETMINACLIYRCEMSFCGRYDVSARTNQKKVGLCHKREEIITPKECLRKIFIWDDSDFASVDKLYNSTLWEGVRFPVGKVCEDIGTIYKIIARCNKIYLLPFPFYNYYHHDNSITTSKFSAKKLDFYYFAVEINEYINKTLPSLEKESDIFRLCAINYSICILKTQPYSVFKKYRDKYKEFKPFVKSTKNIWKNMKNMPNGIINLIPYYYYRTLSLYLLKRKIHEILSIIKRKIVMKFN